MPKQLTFWTALATATLSACAVPESQPDDGLFAAGKADSPGALYCGAVTAIGIENDIWSNYRLELKNDDRSPAEAVIKDEVAVVAGAEIVNGGPVDTVSFDWWAGNSDDNYFMCVYGEFNQEPYVRNVTKLVTWKNGAPLATWEPNAQPNCYEALLNGLAADSAMHQVYADEVPGFYETSGMTVELAQAGLALLKEQLGCKDDGSFVFGVDEATCTEVAPGKPHSTVCHMESTAGYWLVSRDYVSNINIIFNRWD